MTGPLTRMWGDFGAAVVVSKTVEQRLSAWRRGEWSGDISATSSRELLLPHR
jgi:hypothetical protein